MCFGIGWHYDVGVVLDLGACTGSRVGMGELEVGLWELEVWHLGWLNLLGGEVPEVIVWVSCRCRDKARMQDR